MPVDVKQERIFFELAKSSTIIENNQGIFEFHFQEKKQADDFSAWLKTSTTKEIQVHEKTEYVVELSSKQLFRLTDEDNIATRLRMQRRQIGGYQLWYNLITIHHRMPLNEVKDPRKIKAQLESADPKDVNELLVMQNRAGNNFLKFIAANYLELLDILIAKASDDALNQAVMAKNKQNSMVFAYLVKQASGPTLKALIEKLRPETLKKILETKDKLDFIPLFYALQKLDSDTARHLLEIVSKKTIEEVVNYKDEFGLSIFQQLAQRKQYTALDYLITNTPIKTLEKALRIEKDQTRTLAWIESNIRLLNDPTDVEIWVKLLLKLAGKTKDWPTNESLTDLKPLIEHRVWFKDPMTRQMSQFIINKLTSFTDPQFSSKKIVLQLGNRNHITLPHPDLVKLLRTHGLASWQDVYLLHAYASTHPEIPCLDEEFELIQKYKTPQLYLLHPNIYAINKELNEGNLLMKIVNEVSWPDFVRQLKTPSYRPALRAQVNDADTPYKFHHLTGEIKPYRGKKPRPKSQYSTHGKKQSMTLISPKKCTPLFGQGIWFLPTVGIAMRADPNLAEDAYDPKKAKLRALLTGSSATHYRRWRGTHEKVTVYAQEMQKINYTSLEDFKEAIKDNTTFTNEVLAQPTKDALLGIVIGRNTEAARKLARRYQQDIQRELGIALPIISYNSKKNIIIEDDDVGLNPEKLAKDKFLAKPEHQSYIFALNHLASYYGVDISNTNSSGRGHRFFNGQWNRKHIKAVSSVVKKHACFGMNAIVKDRSVTALLNDLKNALLAAGNPLNPNGALTKYIKSMQHFQNLNVIDVDELNHRIRDGFIDHPQA